MSKGRQHINYTAHDIEQYLAGNLTPREMHALEKAALNDPFLAEAMEGFEAFKNAEWNNSLVALREQVAEKGAGAKIIPLHKKKNNYWKTAAAIFVLGSGIALTYVLTRDKTQPQSAPQIAQVITAAKDSAGGLKEEETISRIKSLNPTASADVSKKVPGELVLVDKQNNNNEKAGAGTKEEPAGKRATYNKSNELTGAEVVINLPPPAPAKAGGTSEIKVPEGEAIVSKSQSTEDRMKEANIRMSKKEQPAILPGKEPALNNYFTAQVVSPDNSPLPFTNISIKKENFGTYADAKGMVRLVSTDSILVVDLKAVGYAPKSFLLRNGQLQTKIILNEDPFAAKDQMVIGDVNKAPNLRSRRATLVTDSAVSVEPVDGWENYNTYVANNLDLPETELLRDIPGEVELSFDVKPNGTISNIRVNKSLGSAYDEAAKRLIMQGPQWKVKQGKNTSANVKLKF